MSNSSSSSALHPSNGSLNNAAGSSSASGCFPTGGTVPFPYAEPYPQQIDLMETLLQSLRLLRNGTSESPNNKPGEQPQQHCPVFMLESPTGTGKSLSLACAAMAWLRHVEEEDLQQDNSSSKNSSNGNPNTQPENSSREAAGAPGSKTNKAVVTDWLDDWVSPEQLDRQARQQQVRAQAVAARQALANELQTLRDTSANGDKSEREHEDDARRQRRERTVRAAVGAARQADRNASHNKKSKKQRVVTPSIQDQSSSPDMEFCLDAYHSDENESMDTYDDSDDDDDDDDSENGKTKKPFKSFHGKKTPVPLQAKELLDGGMLDGSRTNNSTSATPPPPPIANVVPGTGVRKIVYAARTHSQLSQFVGELRRTAWGGTVRVAHLGGRKALCGHAHLQRLSERNLNEACLDLQKGIALSTTATAAVGTDKSTTKNTATQNTTLSTTNQKRGSSSSNSASTKSSGCPLLASRDAAVPTLALHLLAQPTDIEEAAALGQASHTCAYYASRASVAAAEVVVLPYSMLLSPQTRQAVGLSLQQSLVIVDEAHNLPEALRSLHCTRLSLPVVQAALDQLKAYIGKYAERLAGRNLVYLGQIRRILLGLQKHLTAKPEKRREGMVTAGELLVERKLDNINLFRVLRYLERSRLSQKLLGFSNYTKKLNDDQGTQNASVNGGSNDGDMDGLSKHVSAMAVVQSFLEKLSFSGKEGKIVTDWPAVDRVDDSRSSRSTKHPTLRYVLLQPAVCFEQILEEAHALALVGGTLRPFVHVAAELLGEKGQVIPQAAKADAATATTTATSQISNSFVTPSFTAFTCDHVVSSSNVLLQCIATGPSGQPLDFRFQSRSTDTVCDELGQTLIKLCETAPSGVVVFLSSYSYEALLVRRWKKTGAWQALQSAKKVHREPKSSQHVEAALQAYARDAVGKGALLLSVVGGKMSEGINFSNDMARCVVVVGLPYPDITDPELKEKMTALDASPDKTITGQAYYQNLCMRAVNQSVGRAIRHAHDYAAIVLIDRRYTSDGRIWSGLPNWLKRGGSVCRQDLPLEKRLTQMKAFFATQQK